MILRVRRGLHPALLLQFIEYLRQPRTGRGGVTCRSRVAALGETIACWTLELLCSDLLFQSYSRHFCFSLGRLGACSDSRSVQSSERQTKAMAI